MRVEFKNSDEKGTHSTSVEMPVAVEVGEIVFIDDESFKVWRRWWSVHRSADGTPRVSLIVFLKAWKID